MRIGMIYQPCGLGDILFLQKIAHYMKELKYDVYWPVISEFDWLNEYIPYFNFISWEDNDNKLNGPPLPESVSFPRKEDYLPNKRTEMSKEFFFFQGFGNYSPIMAGKYDHIGMDWTDWRDYILFNRNIEKENELFYNILGLSDNEEYVFVNRNYRTRPNKMIYPNISIDPDDYNSKVIELKIIDGFSIFDWCKVLENAKIINMIETSMNYLLESPQLFDTIKEKQLILHSSHNNFSEVRYLFNLPWSYQ